LQIIEYKQDKNLVLKRVAGYLSIALENQRAHLEGGEGFQHGKYTASICALPPPPRSATTLARESLTLAMGAQSSAGSVHDGTKIFSNSPFSRNEPVFSWIQKVAATGFHRFITNDRTIPTLTGDMGPALLGSDCTP